MVEYSHVAYRMNCLNKTIAQLVLFFLYLDWFSRYSIPNDILKHHGPLSTIIGFLLSLILIKLWLIGTQINQQIETDLFK